MTEPANAHVAVDEGQLAPPQTAAVLTVDLRTLQRNWLSLRRQALPAQCAAVVKADAYGLGLIPCACALWAAGCRVFFVALPQEGLELKARLPGAIVYVLDGLLPGLGPLYAAHDLVPVLASPDEVAEWSKLAGGQGKRLEGALHIDTGMNRLGLSEAEVRSLAERPAQLAGIEVRLIMSHLACADEPAAEMNELQRRVFDRLRTMLPAAPASFANSPAIYFGPEFAYDLVRPGVALYGGNPFASRPNPMSPVAYLYATILQVRDLAPGDTVGYGADWRASRPSRLGVIGVGYGDGFPRALASSPTGPAQVYVGGHFAPVVGRVSMDLMTIDLTDVPPEIARRGATVELLGDNITVDDLAYWAATIPYEILTGLGSRFTRLYSSFESPR